MILINNLDPSVGPDEGIPELTAIPQKKIKIFLPSPAA
jgi:hypothetical protein